MLYSPADDTRLTLDVQSCTTIAVDTHAHATQASSLLLYLPQNFEPLMAHYHTAYHEVGADVCVWVYLCIDRQLIQLQERITLMVVILQSLVQITTTAIEFCSTMNGTQAIIRFNSIDDISISSADGNESLVMLNPTISLEDAKDDGSLKMTLKLDTADIMDIVPNYKALEDGGA